LKNIGILEIHYHVKFLNTMIRICKTKNTNVTIFTTEEIFSRLKINLDDCSKYEFILKKEGESINHFLKRVKKICNDRIDLLFINTIQTTILDLYRYLPFNPKSKMILTIHITNHWFIAKYAFNRKNILRSIDANICIFLIKTIILPRFNAVNVLYPPTREYVLKNTNYKNEIFTFPFNFYDEKKRITTSTKDDKIRIVISGRIEEFRRDYDLALDIFEKLSERFKEKLILYLLGPPIGKYGDKIIEKCRVLQKKGCNINFHTDFVPEENYNKTLAECDILFSPLKIKKIIDTGIEETYGTSEGSAIPYEAIQNSKPLILPKKFQIIHELKNSTLQYGSPKDLENIFVELIEHRDNFNKLKKEAEKNSRYFSLKLLQKYFTNELLNKLDDL